MNHRIALHDRAPSQAVDSLHTTAPDTQPAHPASVTDSGRYYDAISQGYDELHGDEQRAKYQLIADRLALPPEARVLDVGAGSGLGFAIIPSVGIDPSAALLARHPHPESVVGMAESLPFPDHSFDAVISVTALHHADVPTAIREMKRVSRGPIAITLLRRSASTPALTAQIAQLLTPLTIFEQAHDRILLWDPRQTGVRSREHGPPLPNYTVR